MGKKGEEFDILRNFKGVVKPGEMVLVLGKPGSGCTTFLKVISNQRYGYTKVDGKVLYGPFDSDFFEKRYRGEAVYCEEDENYSHGRSDTGLCARDEGARQATRWSIKERFQGKGHQSDVEDVQH
jgi:ABC-type multidrug transport system ATPase subunit